MLVGCPRHNGRVLLADLAATSTAVAATSSRTRKVELIADRLRAADPAEVAVVVAYLSGELLQRRTGVGWASLRSAPEPAPAPTLTVTEVDETFERLATAEGKGS